MVSRYRAIRGHYGDAILLEHPQQRHVVISSKVWIQYVHSAPLPHSAASGILYYSRQKEGQANSIRAAQVMVFAAMAKRELLADGRDEGCQSWAFHREQLEAIVVLLALQSACLISSGDANCHLRLIESDKLQDKLYSSCMSMYDLRHDFMPFLPSQLCLRTPGPLAQLATIWSLCSPAWWW